MPGKPAASLQDDIRTSEDMEQTPNELSEQVVRELTQTDRLNKRLLTSFLQRMNNSSGEFSALQQDDDQEQQSSGTTAPSENEF